MIYFISGILIILLMIRIREWKEKADAWDRYNYSKLSVYLPSIKELVQSKQEEQWNRVFHSFYKQTIKFIKVIKWKKRNLGY